MASNINGRDLKQIDDGIKINLGGKTYGLALDFNAICDLEEKYGSFEAAAKVLDNIGSDFSKPEAMRNIRFILCVMLRHSDDEMTEREAGKLITMQNVQDILNALGKAMSGEDNDEVGESIKKE